MNEIEKALQDCLHQIQKGDRTLKEALSQYPHLKSELRPLLETALWLEERRESLSLSEEQFVTSRERLLQHIQNQKPRSAVAPPKRSKTWLRNPLFVRLAYAGFIALLVSLILAFIGGGIALAAQNSLPGESLYPVKLSLEEAQIALVSNPLQQSQIRMSFAEKRLTEAVELSRLRKYEAIPMLVEQYQLQIEFVLKAMEESAQSSPVTTKQTANEFQKKLMKNIETLTGLVNQVPPQASQAMRAAIEASTVAVHSIEIIQTTTPTAQFSATLTPNFVEENPQATPTATSFVPPGQWSKTATSLSPTATHIVQPTLKPSKTPKPTRTIKPANTHKPPTKPPPVKPTKKPKP